MISGQSLHDKATRGEILTDEEQLLLAEWYETQDKLEAEILGVSPIISENTMQNQIETGLDKIL